jgi:hypothetical protein
VDFWSKNRPSGVVCLAESGRTGEKGMVFATTEKITALKINLLPDILSVSANCWLRPLL